MKTYQQLEDKLIIHKAVISTLKDKIKNARFFNYLQVRIWRKQLKDHRKIVKTVSNLIDEIVAKEGKKP